MGGDFSVAPYGSDPVRGVTFRQPMGVNNYSSRQVFSDAAWTQSLNGFGQDRRVRIHFLQSLSQEDHVGVDYFRSGIEVYFKRFGLHAPCILKSEGGKDKRALREK